MPAAEEEQRGHAADGDHVGVFGHEEHGELHGAVLGVIAGDELAFGLGQIEGRAVGLGVGGHEVDEEGDELEAAEDVPAERCRGRTGCSTMSRRLSDCGAQHDADQRKAERELVADHLRRWRGASRAARYLLFDDQPESAMP